MTRVWLLHPDIRTRSRGRSEPGGGQARRSADAQLAEAVGLTEALDVDLIGAEIVRISSPHPGALFGSGKLEELGLRLEADEIDLVVIDGPVSPVQQRNLERRWKVKILDRTGLILEIFGDRARTREGVMQVELAHLSYQRTRLVRAWTHLERQRGGLGFVGGPGETQVEADRRALDERINGLKRQLAKVARTRTLHRAARKRVPYPVVALVGYTNAGKSTLFNQLTEAGVTARDMLFATLDPTMRAIDLPTGRRVILSDTVGFISNLPTQLVAAFRATLEEVLEADLLIHVRDMAHGDCAAQAEDVAGVLAELGVGEQTPVIEAWNKIDVLDDEAQAALRNAAARAPQAAALSAVSGEGVEDLARLIETALPEPRRERHLRLTPSAGKALAWLYARGGVSDRRDTDEAVMLTATLSEREFNQFAAAFPDARLVR